MRAKLTDVGELFAAFEAGADCCVHVAEGVEWAAVEWGAVGGPYFVSTAKEAREIAGALQAEGIYLDLAAALEAAAAIADGNPFAVRH